MQLTQEEEEMIPNGKEMNWDGHRLVFESTTYECRGCFFENRGSCPDCDEGIWVEENPSPWHTGTPTESGEYLVCIRYDFGKEGYTTADYVEPYNPHTGWYNLKPPSEISADEWCKKNGIKVIAWQKIEPYKEE